MRGMFVVVSLCGISTLASASILNGSFETNAVPSGERLNPSNVTDWTHTAGFTLHEKHMNGVSVIAAHSGTQFLSMGHNGSANDRIQQSFATVVGSKYDVSFYVHCIQGNAQQAITADVLDLVNAGPALGSVVASVSSMTQGWIEYTFSFVATSNQSQLRFTHSQAAGGANIALDTVTVIPAPATALLGVVALAAGRRRRGG